MSFTQPYFSTKCFHLFFQNQCSPRLEKRLYILVFCSIFFTTSNAQITKKCWLVGGDISYKYTDHKDDVIKYQSHSFDISPKFGYFFTDKFSAGLKLSFQSINSDAGSSGGTKINTLYFGPFLRYYFLPTENRYNIFIEPCYQYYNRRNRMVNEGSLKGSVYSFSAGPVIFLNSVVAVEFGLKFEHGEYSYHTKENNIQPTIGLQIHLEKE